MDKQKTNNTQQDVNHAAAHLLHEGKEYAHALYDDGLKHAKKIQNEVKDYSDEMLENVRKHPLKAILIAGGVGMLLSALLRK